MPPCRGRRRSFATVWRSHGLRAGLSCPASFGFRPPICFRRSARGMRACIYVIAGGCGLVTVVGAAVRSCLTHRGRVLREIARPRTPLAWRVFRVSLAAP